MLADALTCSFRHQQYKRLLACESRELYRLLVALPFLCPYPFQNKQRKSKWAGEQRVTYTYAGGSSLHFSATSITCNSDLHSSLHSIPVQLLWWLHNELGKNRKGTLIRAICACVGTSQSNLPFCSSPELWVGLGEWRWGQCWLHIFHIYPWVCVWSVRQVPPRGPLANHM